MGILNSIKKRLPNLMFWLLLFECCTFAQINNAKNSIFPLIPGSYWVRQDTFFIREDEIAAQEGGMNPFNPIIDSIKSVFHLSKGYHIVGIQRIGTNKKREVRIEYYVDEKGNVFEAKKLKGSDSLKIGLCLWKMFPQKGDTVFEYGFDDEPLIYQQENTDSTIVLTPCEKSQGLQSTYKFKKGIGLIGQIYPTTATRLIEYRIGNGPIVKKRWIMKKPEEK